MIVCYYIEIDWNDPQVRLDNLLRDAGYDFVDMTDAESRLQFSTLEEVKEAFT